MTGRTIQTEVAVARGSRAVAELEDDWRALWSRLSDATIFSSWGWQHCLLATFAANYPEILGLRLRLDGDTVLGFIARLERHRLGPLRVQVLTALEGYNTQICPMLLDTGAGMPAEQLVDQALSAMSAELRGGWGMTVLRNVLEDTPLALALEELAARGGHLVRRVKERDTPIVELPGSYEEYLASRSRHLRKKLRKSTRELEAFGSVEFEVLHDPGEIAAALPECWEIEAASWKAERGELVQRNPIWLAFMNCLAQDLASEGETVLFRLRAAGRTASYLLAHPAHGRLYALKTSYDTDFAKASPTILLLGLVIQWCIEQGHSEFHFLGNANPYKMRYTDLTRQVWRYYVFPPTWRGRALRAAFELKSRLSRGSVGVIRQE